MKRETVHVRNYTLHFLQVRHGQGVNWYITPKGCDFRHEENILEEGWSSTPKWAKRDASSALFNRTGIRE